MYFPTNLHPASGNGFSVQWTQCFLIKVIFLLLETIIGLLGKQFSKKELNFASGKLIIWLVGTIFFHFLRQQSTVASRSSFSFNWNIFLRAYSCQWAMIFWLVETIFFLHFSETPASNSFFPPNGNVFFKKIVHSGQWKRIQN